MVYLINSYGRGTHENHRHLHSAAKVKDRGDYIVFENERRSLLPPFSWGSRYVRLPVRISNKYIISHVEERKNFWRYRIQQISIIFMNILLSLSLSSFHIYLFIFINSCLFFFVYFFIYWFIHLSAYLRSYIFVYLFIYLLFFVIFFCYRPSISNYRLISFILFQIIDLLYSFLDF